MKLFDEISDIVPKLHGGTWAHQVLKGHALAAIILALRPQTVVEIGVFGGGSLIPMAMALRTTGRGLIVGIDPWDSAAAADGYEGPNREFWLNCNLEGVFSDFQKALYITDTASITTIQRTTSDMALVPESIDLLHVDGQHTEQAVRDVRRFACKVPVCGIVVADDTNWTNSGNDQPVRRAVAELMGMGFKQLYQLGTGEVFIRQSR